tara:strand:+ start:5028 stop:5405 length:378 start_codon:yes stop_codon:yes gene_type:complete
MNLIKLRPSVIFYCVIILLLSSIPAKSFPILPLFGLDKFVHLIEYTFFGILLLRCVVEFKLIPVLLMFSAGILFGIIDEFWQSMIPGRITTLEDWLADSAGVILGGTIVIITKLSAEKFKSKQNG